MNIAQVSPYDYAYPGGVNTHISHLALQLAKMGHHIKILAPCSNKKALPSTEGIIPLGKTIPWISNGSVARITLSMWLLPKIKPILEDGEFDIMHFHEPLFPSLPWIVLPQSRSVNVATFHAYYRRSIGYWYWQPLCTWYYKMIHGKIAVSEWAKGFVSRYFPGDYNIIPHGVDTERFSPEIAPIEDFCDGKLNILFVSRLEKRKGITYLLKAFERVKKEIPQSRIIIVGPGNKDRYQELVNTINLKDVVFTGGVSHADLPRYYRTADIFCIPATGQESFGIVLLEAMAAGKPIVASNIPGFASVLTHDIEGLLVPPRDDEALADALLSLLKDQDLRQQMGSNGRSKAEKHSWESIARRTVDFYLESANGKTGKRGGD
ncbi:glycosyltransferase family 4 protein [Chloroflexota bacterium]